MEITNYEQTNIAALLLMTAYAEATTHTEGGLALLREQISEVVSEIQFNPEMIEQLLLVLVEHNDCLLEIMGFTDPIDRISWLTQVFNNRRHILGET